MNKTAVDLLIEEMQKVMMPEQMADMEWPIFIAKRREKQQIVDAYCQGDYDNTVSGLVAGDKEGEEYYNETYGGQADDL
jgi:hypothetical protein